MKKKVEKKVEKNYLAMLKNNLYPTNPFYYCLLVRQEQLLELNRALHPRTKKSLKRRFYDIAILRSRIQAVYPNTMLQHPMNPYQYKKPRGKVIQPKRVTQIYLYRENYDKNDWIRTKRFFEFQKTKYYVTSKEHGFHLVNGR